MKSRGIMKEATNKLVVIGCYFGKLPDYFDLWLKSCENNKTVDFIVFTDGLVPNWYPNNVKFTSITLIDMKKQFEKKLGYTVALDSAYKVCDLRPAYGYLFEDYIKGYDFWGHCDFDIIWGNIREYVTEEMLNSFDKIFNLGHLSFYRNNKELNNAYKLDGGAFLYKEVFQNSEHYAFDEISGINLILKKNNFEIYETNLCANMTKANYRMRLVESTSIKNYNQQVFYWENGKIHRAYIYEEKVYIDEFIYLHFQWKSPKNTITNIDELKSFYILSDRFKEKQLGIPTKDIIIELSNFTSAEYEKKEKNKYIIKQIKRFFKISNKERGIWIRQKKSRKINL